MKEWLCTAIGLVGSAVATALGGWDTGLQTLIIFMAIDYMTGLIVAGVYKKSPKTENGKLQSDACFKGLCKKGMALVIILIACRLDLIIGTDYIRDAVIMAFIASEGISIIENAIIMDIPVPKVVREAIEVISKEGD